jgi:hypothetical protein
VLALLRAGRPAPGRAPPRAIDYSCGLILFKAHGAIQSARGYSKRLQQRRARRLRPPPIVAGIPYICPPPIAFQADLAVCCKTPRRRKRPLEEGLNLAARLQGLSAPNSAVLSEVTARMVGHFALDDLGLHDLKGIARRCAGRRNVRLSPGELIPPPPAPIDNGDALAAEFAGDLVRSRGRPCDARLWTNTRRLIIVYRC